MLDIQDISNIAVHVNKIPYHQRELAMLMDELLRLNDKDKEKLSQEIELGKRMITIEREAERKRKRKALGYVEGMEREQDDLCRDINTSPLSVKPSNTKEAVLPVSDIPTQENGQKATQTSGRPTALSSGSNEQKGLVSTATTHKFEHHARQLSWSALKANDEAHNDFYFSSKLTGHELVQLQDKRQALSSIVCSLLQCELAKLNSTS